ncbi:MAG TPA: hypothetical protein VGJ84_17580 [Polyangiaceae bacterium]|jgi:predicted flap endonuclease-1-like 5' DNA nuclease
MRLEAANLRAKLEQAQREIAQLSTMAESAKSIASLEPPDDLTQIRGIGPKFARALHAMDVRRIAQIAEWTDIEIERIADHLKIRPERIHREQWVDSARGLTTATH